MDRPSRSSIEIPVRLGRGARAFVFGGIFVFLAGNGRAEDSGQQTLRAAAQRHGLLMGTAAEADLLSDSIYPTILKTEYSALEPESEMKFANLHPDPAHYDFADADRLVDFADEHGMKVRGHNLVWQESLPGWIAAPRQPWTPQALKEVLKEHIAAVAGHYKGKVYAWDVVNEPFNDDGSMRSDVWYDKPGIGFAGQGTNTIEQAFRWAHEADPGAKLFVNEYGAEGLNKKSDAVYAMASDFVKRGVPLSGIGMQLHITPDFDQPESLNDFTRNVKRLSALGLEVQFTEVDVSLRNGKTFSLSEQAATYKDVLDVCLRQPQCTLFQTWGFTDGHSWIPKYKPGFGWALPFDAAYKKKPAYRALLKKLDTPGTDGPRPLHAR